MAKYSPPQVGQFCEMNNRMLWDAPKSKLLKDIWPRDYIRRRCRMVEGQCDHSFAAGGSLIDII